MREPIKALLFALRVAAVAAAPAVAAGPLKVEEAFQSSSFLAMQLAPDGRFIAAIGQANRGTGLILIDAASLEAKLVKGESPALASPRAAHWINHDILAVDGGTSIDILKASGELVRTIRGSYIRNVQPDRNGHERILVRRVRPTAYIDRVDLRTGDVTLTNFDMPGDPQHWVFDAEGIPRVVTTTSTGLWSDKTKITHWYRQSIDGDWQQLGTFSFIEDHWIPVYLMEDGKSLAVTSRHGRDTWAYFRFDLETRRITDMLAGHPLQDIYATRNEADDNYRQVVTLGMKPETIWFDEGLASLQRSVDATLPGRINRIVGRAADKALVHSYADVDPGRWYLLDTGRMTLREIAAAKPAVDVAKMRPMQIVTYAAPDDLQIPAYLTLPDDVTGPMPAIVLIHGGPVARDRWAWNAEVQLLASRGYVVFQPQFRGSSGFGKRFTEAGYGQWGLAMQDDVSAGVRWLIEKKIADPNRICIYGGSYGGYAAMWGLIKTPELYRCGISLAGVSDIEYMFRDDSDVNDWATGRLWRQVTVGDLKTHKQQFDEVSPLKKAGQIRVPVLIAHGNRDRRVPISHSEKLIAALKEANKSYQWIELENEGHGIASEKNRQRFYEALFEFLQKHIGAGMAER